MTYKYDDGNSGCYNKQYDAGGEVLYPLRAGVFWWLYLCKGQALFDGGEDLFVLETFFVEKISDYQNDRE